MYQCLFHSFYSNNNLKIVNYFLVFFHSFNPIYKFQSSKHSNFFKTPIIIKFFRLSFFAHFENILWFIFTKWNELWYLIMKITIILCQVFQVFDRIHNRIKNNKSIYRFSQLVNPHVQKDLNLFLLSLFNNKEIN